MGAGGDGLTDEVVTGGRSPFADRLALLLRRLCILAGCTVIGYQAPLPMLDEWLPVRNILVACVSIAAAGKLLVDTLFYDRFWP